jgi:regulator of sigma D
MNKQAAKLSISHNFPPKLLIQLVKFTACLQFSSRETIIRSIHLSDSQLLACNFRVYFRKKTQINLKKYQLCCFAFLIRTFKTSQLELERKLEKLKTFLISRCRLVDRLVSLIFLPSLSSNFPSALEPALKAFEVSSSEAGMDRARPAIRFVESMSGEVKQS